MGYSKEKEKYQVTEIDITLDTDDKEEQEREYINNITSRIMEIANDYIDIPILISVHLKVLQNSLRILNVNIKLR